MTREMKDIQQVDKYEQMVKETDKQMNIHMRRQRNKLNYTFRNHKDAFVH